LALACWAALQALFNGSATTAMAAARATARNVFCRAGFVHFRLAIRISETP
jgi:hypothetical protein